MPKVTANHRDESAAASACPCCVDNCESGARSKSAMVRHLEHTYRSQTKPYSVFKVPLSCQLSTNSVSIRHQSRISFLEKLMPEKDFSDLNCLVQINHKLGLNPKQFDEEFSSIVRQFNDRWEQFQQEFIAASREEKQRRLREDPSLRIQLIQLTKYLEKYQILKLRAKYPMIQEENLLVHLRQQHYLPDLMRTLDHKVQMLERLAEAAKKQQEQQQQQQSKPSPSDLNEDDGSCLICCEEAERVTYPCGHSCCCSSCSKSLTQCPLCRASINHHKQQGVVESNTRTSITVNET